MEVSKLELKTLNVVAFQGNCVIIGVDPAFCEHGVKALAAFHQLGFVNVDRRESGLLPPLSFPVIISSTESGAMDVKKHVEV
ncbi:conserved hypothetical protein [Coccidioides posadasii str. Silveira]|uniref:Uncharacterized protein n=1 Tax=Coccidioides posadasii (strain RMSCC 757 / Silveira) TaxID=443226 RepID=E9DER2_COCPS|nr:conserved hypothetical protein [Coccidioides posadasii str. Silveira]